MIVAHNVSAINTYNQMNKSIGVSNKSMEKLSSGYRINTAADDAAGLSISEKMRAQIRGLNQASENAMQGISYLQVADGALNEIDSMLHRIRELAINSANGIYKEFSEYEEGEIKLDETDRAMLDREVQQLKSEMDRVFETTEYNTMKIWTPPQGKYIDHVSIASQNTISSPTIVWSSSGSITSYLNNNNKGAVPNTNTQIIATENGIKVSWDGYNGKHYESLEMPLNPDLVGSYYFSLDDYMDYDLYPDAVGINGVLRFSIDPKATREEVFANLERKFSTGEYVYSVPVLKFNTGNYSNDISISSSTYRSGLSNKTYYYFNYNSFLVNGKDFENIDNSFIVPTNGGNNIVNPCVTKNPNDKFEFTFTMPNIGNVKATVTNMGLCSKVNEGPDNKTNGWWYSYISSGKTRTDYNIYNANTPKESIGTYQNLVDLLNVNTGMPIGSIFDLANGGIITMKVSVTSDSPYALPSGGTSNAIGSFCLNIEVNPEDTFDDVINKIADIKGLDFNDSDSSEYSTLSVSKLEKGTSSLTTTEYNHDYELVSYDDIHLLCHVGPNADQVIDLKHKTLRVKTMGLENTNILTRKDANNAIGEVIKALDIVNAERSNFGALQNRLEHTIESLNSTSENMQNAESIIRDTDMAEEMMSEVKSSILQQASQAMLTQAMQRPQQVLELLKQ